MIVKAFSFHETTNWGLKCPFDYNVDKWSFLSFSSCLSLLVVIWKSEVNKNEIPDYDNNKSKTQQFMI